jgi:hypothetical protein
MITLDIFLIAEQKVTKDHKTLTSLFVTMELTKWKQRVLLSVVRIFLQNGMAVVQFPILSNSRVDI